MFWNSKVVWSEGMLLQQQHLQQHDRYLESRFERLHACLGGYHWGFSKLLIDESLLAMGKVALLDCEGVMPDGTVLSLPRNDDLPVPLDIPLAKRNALVVLALPLRRPGIAEYLNEEEQGQESYARYLCTGHEVLDSNHGTHDSTYMQLGKLRLKLAFQDELSEGYATLGVAHVIERNNNGEVICDTQYVPPCTDYRVSRRLSTLVNEMLGLLGQRGDALAGRLMDPVTNGVAEMHDFLQLQAVNRAETLLKHLAGLKGLHPEVLYRELLQLYGEMVGFVDESRRPPQLEPYRHHELNQSFDALIRHLRHAFSRMHAPQVVAIPIEERAYGLRVGIVHDANLFTSALFVLAVKADMPVDALCHALVAKMKLGPVEIINNLVNLQLPGLGFHLLPVAPRQLPFHADFVYFGLDHKDAAWSQLGESGGIALYVAGEIPGLTMQLWAIRR